MKTFLICIALATVALAKPLGDSTEAAPTTLAAAKPEEKLPEVPKSEATTLENKDAAAPNTTPVEELSKPTFAPPRPILPIEVKKEDLKEAVKEEIKPQISEATTPAAAAAEEKKPESKVDIVEAANVPAGVADDVVDPVAIITPEKKIETPAKEESNKAKETSTGATPVDDALRVKSDSEKITEAPKVEEKKSEAVVAEPKPEESAKPVETTPAAEKKEEKRSTESTSAEATTVKSAEKPKDSSSEKDSSSAESSEESTEKTH